MRKTTLRTAMTCTVAMALAATAAGADRPVSETRAVAPDAAISIETIAGAVEVVGIDATELRITGTLGDDVEKLDIRGDANDIKIEVKIPDGDHRKARKVAAELQIQVPRGASIEVEAVSATVAVRGVTGAVEVEAVSGAVSVEGANAPVEVESVSGQVSVTGGGGKVSAESVSGAVMLKGASGDLEATTVSGKIRIEAGTVGDVELESLSGDVHFQGTLAADGKLEVEAHSGNVRLLLPAGLGASWEMSTFSGRIDNAFGSQPRRTDRYEPGLVAEFVTGTGAAEVTVETFSGNISVESF